MRFLSLFLFAILISCSASAQSGGGKSSKKAEKMRDEALAFIRDGMVEEAKAKLEEAVEDSPEYVEGLYDLGLIYMTYLYQPDYAQAVHYFERAYQINPAFQKSFPYTMGSAYFHNMDFDKAEEALNTMLADPEFEGKMKEDAEHLLKCIDFAREALKNPVPFDPVNLGKAVNTPYTEMFPALTADGEMVFFTRSDFAVNGTEDIWFSYKNSTDGPWEKSINLGPPVNSPRQNEGAHCISPDGRFLFFTICGSPNSVNYSCDIFYSQLDNGYWTEPKNVGRSINTGAWESQPALSADSKSLYFVSNRKGGYGQSDIYVSHVEDGWFTEPINLGPVINTSGNEERPQIHTDNQTLYFSSEGHIGMGGFDLYMSRKKGEDGWEEPVNLGYPINTPGYENAIFVDNSGEFALLSSEREGGYGQADIYSFDIPDHIKPLTVTYVKGIVLNAETKEPLKANVQIIDLETGEPYVTTVSDPSLGFLLTVPAGKDYAYNVNKDGFLFYSKNFAFSEADPKEPYVMEILLKPVKVGESVVMRNVFFETGSYELLPKSKTELDKLVELLNNNPTMRIEIGGHTDNVGDETDNQILSENRAKSVRDYLVESGIQESRLEFAGYGETEPIDTNDTPEGRANNRRTEFKVIE